MWEMSAADYELAVLEKVRQDFAGTAIQVRGTENGKKHLVRGRHSLTNRQLDVAAYKLAESHPFLVVDAKRRRRKLHVQDVEAFIGLIDDIGAGIGGLVAPLGSSDAAKRRAQAAAVQVDVLTIEEALRHKWLKTARELSPMDWHFRPDLFTALRLLHVNAAPLAIIESLEVVPFEEWDALVAYALREHPSQAQHLLRIIAKDHPDDGWRFNAIRHLEEAGLLDTEVRNELLATERDRDVLDLLLQQGDWAV
jgi:hypothetical protein